MADVLCPVVVGRDAEIGALGAALGAALGGAGRMVFLTGEPGIGKSRLAREVAGQARARGAAVVTGRAVPAGASSPYRPLTEALLQALRVTPVDTGGELGPWLPVLGTIVPALAVPSPGEASAAARGEAVIRLLQRLAPPDGLVLVLEDLHWADPDTLAVIEYLSDNLDGVPLLCLATSRDEPQSEALAMIRRVHGRRGAEHLPLARLEPGQVAAMIQACVPGAGEELTARVQRAADGVPFLVEEVLAAPGVPASFRDAVQARLAGLTEGERAVLEAAAVLGRHFDWRLLGGATGQGPDEVARALGRGVGQLLLTVDGAAFRFRHALTREAVAEAMLPPRRAVLAAAVLAQVDAVHPRLEGGWRDAAADLAEQCGDTERAGRLLAASGIDSLDRGALATAASTLRRAAGLLGEGPSRQSAQARLVQALALAGLVDEAMTVGSSLIADLGGDEATAPDRAHLHVLLAQAAVAATRWPDATRHLAAAAGLLAAGPHDGRQAGGGTGAQVRVLEAEVALATGDVSGARTLAARVLDDTAADPGVRCHALELTGRSERLRDLDAARVAFEQALGVASGAGLAIWRLRALHELGTIELFRHAGSDRLAQARETAAELGALSTAAVLDLQLAAAAHCRFDLEEGAGHAREALTASERLGLAQVRAKALYFLAENHALRRERDGCEHYLARALAAAGDDPAMEGFAWGGCRAMIALLEDDRPAAAQSFSKSFLILRGCPHAEPANFRGVWPLLLAAAGDRRAAAEIRAARELGITVSFANRGMLGYAEAILAGQAGRRERAAELAAAAGADLAGYPVWADLARLAAAPAALAGGWGEPERWLAAARDCFAGRGLDSLAGRCSGLLGDSPAQDRWASLGVTRRESDVLRLVAAGLANKEIAARLCLSPRTVEKHMESLLRKTGARSRTQLVAVAGPPPEGTT